MIEEQKESGEPLELDKMQVRKLLERSGATGGKSGAV